MGLFEDDDEVRPAPRRKGLAPPKGMPKIKPGELDLDEGDLGDRILKKMKAKVDPAAMSTQGDASFAKVSLVNKPKRKLKKSDDGRLVPPINYVTD